MSRLLRHLVFLLGAGLACADAPSPAPTARFADAPDRLFEHPGASIRYRDLSAGDAVILLHGYTDRLETMEALADSLTPGFRVVAVDIRGFGQSTKFADPARYGPGHAGGRAPPDGRSRHRAGPRSRLFDGGPAGR